MTTVAAAATEDDLKATILDAARLFGWLAHHDRPARRQDGRWATAIQGDAGFPDLVLARRGRVIVAELKTATGRTTPGQASWIKALHPAWERAWQFRQQVEPGRNPEVYLWRPDDLPEIIETLR